MTILALGSMLVGMVLGIRFRFIVLVPVLIAGSLALVMIALTAGETGGRTLLLIVVFAGLTQIGYVCTSLMSAFLGHGTGTERPEHDEASRSDQSRWKRVAAPAAQPEPCAVIEQPAPNLLGLTRQAPRERSA